MKRREFITLLGSAATGAWRQRHSQKLRRASFDSSAFASAPASPDFERLRRCVDDLVRRDA
jgi:hypothetical protein